jgi:endonuclease/exonuclease/phosphatase family metal-dependent hydrolase
MKNASHQPDRKLSRHLVHGSPFASELLPKISFIHLALSLFLSGLFSCTTVQVYNEEDKPGFYSNEQDELLNHGADSLNVVTFNIKKGEKINLAMLEFQEFEKTRDIDVYLLQEMDEKGVQAIARTLHLNYIYIPIIYNNNLQKNIGNAILTKGTIAHPAKLILPHSKWLSKGRRLVTIGEVNIHRKKILVYSVHTETVVMSRKNRMEQVDAIIGHAKMQLPNYQYLLIGGDFNTLLSRDAQLAINKFSSSGFEWSTAAVGSTARAFFGVVKPTHDYVFSRGLKLMNAFKIEGSRSSDHYPVFASFRY